MLVALRYDPCTVLVSPTLCNEWNVQKTRGVWVVEVQWLNAACDVKEIFTQLTYST